MSATRIHSKISKVVNNPKNHPIFIIKVVAYPKIISKNIPKVGATYQISNTIPSQICPYHKDKYCPQYTNKIIKLSVLHAHYPSICSADPSIYPSLSSFSTIACHCKAVFADSSDFIIHTIIIFKTPK